MSDDKIKFKNEARGSLGDNNPKGFGVHSSLQENQIKTINSLMYNKNKLSKERSVIYQSD